MTLQAERATLRLGEAEVLKDVSVAVASGTVTALVGPNGAGKSSLLRVLSGELASPRITMDGTPLARLDIRELARRRSVMTQSTSMAFDFLVREVLAMGWVGETEPEAAALEEVASACGLDPLLHRRFNTLSGGERQRVQFARCWLQIWRRHAGNASRYLLLDEPTSSMDLHHELLVLRLARRASATNVGVLIVLHDLNQAARFADRVALMADGAIIANGPPETVLTSETLSRVYRTPVCVEHHARLDRLVVHAE